MTTKPAAADALLRLDTRVSIYRWGVATPDWTGTLREYAEASEATPDDLRDLLIDIDGQGFHRIGGGAAGAFVVRLADALRDRLAAALGAAVVWADCQDPDTPAAWQSWAYDARAALAEAGMR